MLFTRTTIGSRIVSALPSLLVMLLALASFGLASQAHAVGISPPIVEVPNMLRNGKQTHTITVLNAGIKNVDTHFAVTTRGEYAQFIQAPTDFVIPAGKSSAPFSFDINTTNAPIGDYNVYITLTEGAAQASAGSKPSSELNGSVSILQGATLTVRIHVTGKQELSYNLISAHVEDSETKLPLVFDFVVQNTGNVEWKPDKVVLNMTDTLDPTKQATLEIAGTDLPLTEPGEVKDSKVSLDHTLPEGKYVAQASFYYQNAVVGQLTSQPFNIFAPGTLMQSGELSTITTNKTNYSIGENIKLTAPFTNTGDISLDGVLITEVYKDKALVEVMRSDKMSVDKKSQVEFSQIINLSQSGTYTLSAYVQYGNKKTSPQTIDVTVQGELSLLWSSIILGILILILFGCLFIYHSYRQWVLSFDEQGAIDQQSVGVGPDVAAPESQQADAAPRSFLAGQSMVDVPQQEGVEQQSVGVAVMAPTEQHPLGAAGEQLQQESHQAQPSSGPEAAGKLPAGS